MESRDGKVCQDHFMHYLRLTTLNTVKSIYSEHSARDLYSAVTDCPMLASDRSATSFDGPIDGSSLFRSCAISHVLNFSKISIF